MKKMISGVLALLFAASVSAVEVDPNRAVIVVDSKADGVVKFAAQELQKYLHMITGKKIAIADQPAQGNIRSCSACRKAFHCNRKKPVGK